MQQLIEGGLVKAEELGQVVVERERGVAEPAAPVSDTQAEERRTQAEVR